MKEKVKKYSRIREKSGDVVNVTLHWNDQNELVAIKRITTRDAGELKEHYYKCENSSFDAALEEEIEELRKNLYIYRCLMAEKKMQELEEKK